MFFTFVTHFIKIFFLKIVNFAYYNYLKVTTARKRIFAVRCGPRFIKVIIMFADKFFDFFKNICILIVYFYEPNFNYIAILKKLFKYRYYFKQLFQLVKKNKKKV